MKKPNINAAMGDIDADPGANVQIPGTQKDPGQPIRPLDSSNYGGVNSVVFVPPEASGTQVSYTNASFNDDIAQYLRADNAELLRVRNQAMSSTPNAADLGDCLIGRQDSDPKGG